MRWTAALYTAPLLVLSCGSNTSVSSTGTGDMVAIPAGTFMMGCNPATYSQTCPMPETTYHAVTLSAYEIDRTEVTQGAYQQCVAAGACTTPSNDSMHGCAGVYDPIGHAAYPVVCVDWTQADAFCAWAGKRLPTEAEWENAARGDMDGRNYPWGNNQPDCMDGAWLCGCLNGLEPAGYYLQGASPYGVLDMSGNIFQWVNDWWGYDYYSMSPMNDPQGPACGMGDRDIRGSGYAELYTIEMSVWFRNEQVQTDVRRDLGFRCAK